MSRLRSWSTRPTDRPIEPTLGQGRREATLSPACPRRQCSIFSGVSDRSVIDDEPRTSYLVARLDRLLRSRLTEALKPFDISVPQYTVLSVLSNRPGLSNAQLARRSYITAQAMHQMVNGLEGRGLIAREVSSEHGRVQEARLTPKGDALLARCDDEVDRVEERIFGSLGGREESHLRSLIRTSIDSETTEGR